MALLCAALSVAALVAVAVASRGAILEAWYLWRLESGDYEDSLEAGVALAELGSTKAVPLLIRSVDRRGDLYFVETTIPIMGTKALGPVLQVLDETPWEQRSGVMAAVFSLKLDETAVPALIRWLKSPNLHVRWVTTLLLRQLGSAARGSVQALQEALTDAAPEVRESARSALEEIQSE
jgi:HEAT repeat protein